MKDGPQTIALVHPQPGGRTHVRIEDVRYGWASEEGRGMWGIEAVIDAINLNNPLH